MLPVDVFSLILFIGRFKFAPALDLLLGVVSSVKLVLLDVPGKGLPALLFGFEFASINGNDGLAKELEFPANTNEVAAYLANANSVVMAEVRNRFEVWSQASCQPHQLHIALSFPLQPAAGLDAIEVPVDIKFEKNCRVIRRTTCACRCSSVEAQSLQVQFINKGIYDPYRIVLANEVIQALWQQRDLISTFTFDEALHMASTSIQMPRF